MHTCPVCGYGGLPRPAVAYQICPCCGTEFGYDDARRSARELRALWVLQGMRWHSRIVPPPVNWSPERQLLAAQFFETPPAANNWRVEPVRMSRESWNELGQTADTSITVNAA